MIVIMTMTRMMAKNKNYSKLRVNHRKNYPNVMQYIFRVKADETFIKLSKSGMALCKTY